MRLIAGDLLHNVKVVDGREEVAEGEDRDGLLWQRRRGITKLINFGAWRTVQDTRDSPFRGEAANSAATGVQVGTMTGDRRRDSFILTLSVSISRLLSSQRIVRMCAAEMEETMKHQCLASFNRKRSIAFHLRQVITVIPLRHSLVDVLMGKHLQDQRHVIRVK